MCVQETVCKFHTKYGERSDIGIIKAKMIRECGGRQAFEESVESGDVWESEGLWFSRTAQTVERRGVTKSQTLDSGTKLLTPQAAASLTDVMESMEWFVAPTKQEKEELLQSAKRGEVGMEMQASTRATLSKACVRLEKSQKGARVMWQSMKDA